MALLGVLSLGFLIYWVVHNPEPVFRYVQKKYLPQDLKIIWQDSNYEVKKFNFYSARVQFDFSGLQVSKENPQLNFDIDKLGVDLGFNILKLQATVFDFKLLSTKKSFINMAKSENDDHIKNKEESLPISETIKNYLGLVKTIHRYVNLNTVLISIDDFNLNMAEEAMVLGFKLKNSDESHYTLDLQGKSGLKNVKLESKIAMDEILQAQEFVSLKMEYSDLNTKSHMNSKWSYKNETLYTVSDGELNYKNKKIIFKALPSISLNINPESIHSKFKLKIKELPGPIQQLNNIQGTLHIPIENYMFIDRHSEMSVNIPIQSQNIYEKDRERIERKCNCVFPKKVNISAKSKFLLPRLISDKEDVDEIGKMNFDIVSDFNEIFDLKLNGDVGLKKANNYFKVLPFMNVQLEVKSFKRIIPILDYFGIVIPAPLHVLDGKISVKTKKKIDLDQDRYQLPLDINVDLKSDTQTVKVSSLSKILIDSKCMTFHLMNDVVIDDITLQLPDLNPAGGIPRFKTDDRIQTEPMDKSHKPASIQDPSCKPISSDPNQSQMFEIGVDIKSKSKRSIKLLSKFFKPNLPFNVEFQSSQSQENNGSIQIMPFEIVYMRRKMRLVRMKLGISKDKPEAISVDGRFAVQQSFYKINIDVNGYTDSPNIVLSSVPELSRADIISVLLYDKTRDQLVTSDAETAGGVEAAFAMKAIGLFSLWALASTPIRSFYYNPVTKVYTATLALGNGMTAGIGSNWESSAQLELRKRLSKRWVLTGRWVSASATDKRDRSELVLQWESRF